MAYFTVNRINTIRNLQYKNTFLIPEIIYDLLLMLSLYTFLLGILFHDNAFCAPGIRSIGDLRRLFLEGDQ
ncbi:hypothetical protein N7533_012899 [Penicillium manginii]|uniref:uncharacterized protein n=1 Tax=Penicillium manginii TaxID=203109 RepID=UPI00254951C9|nr:uncharacterized protein N7533_012899 [Penicillium manginii]KAJ5740115.1 hypothetical protein N7533_012899 [Penicillium manginii]